MKTEDGSTLTRDQARAFYDRFAWLQEWQGFYENLPLEILVQHSGFQEARSVLELGCGTGRTAERLLARELPENGRYLGLDVSPAMVERTRRRIARFGARADVRVTNGDMPLPVPDGSQDRFVAAYVFDLLSEGDMRVTIDEAHRVLAPGGRLCLASLAPGTTRASRLVARAWTAVHRVAPGLLGGCRPIHVRRVLDAGRWRIAFCSTVTSSAIATEVLVAVVKSSPP